jgi:replication factor C small subunit
MNIMQSLWVEKYRPGKLEEMVLSDEYRQDFSFCIKNREINNFLFYGPPGSGKSCISRILTSKNGALKNPSDNLLEINGSAKETRSINFVDSVIEPYLKIPPSPPDKQKVVFIDEADYLTDQSAHSLRGILEKYSKYGRFIFTCNYVSKIPDALVSRTQSYEFKQIPVEMVEDYSKKILETEKIIYEESQLKYVVGNLYPDIRKIVQCLQKNSMSGTLRVSKDSVLTNEKIVMGHTLEVINFIKNNEDSKISSILPTINKYLSEIDLDFRAIYSDLFFNKQVPVTAKIVINKYANSHNSCLIPSMHYFGMLYEVIKTMQSYKQLMSGKK